MSGFGWFVLGWLAGIGSTVTFLSLAGMNLFEDDDDFDGRP